MRKVMLFARKKQKLLVREWCEGLRRFLIAGLIRGALRTTAALLL